MLQRLLGQLLAVGFRERLQFDPGNLGKTQCACLLQDVLDAVGPERQDQAAHVPRIGDVIRKEREVFTVMRVVADQQLGLGAERFQILHLERFSAQEVDRRTRVGGSQAVGEGFQEAGFPGAAVADEHHDRGRGAGCERDEGTEFFLAALQRPSMREAARGFRLSGKELLRRLPGRKLGLSEQRHSLADEERVHELDLRALGKLEPGPAADVFPVPELPAGMLLDFFPRLRAGGTAQQDDFPVGGRRLGRDGGSYLLGAKRSMPFALIRGSRAIGVDDVYVDAELRVSLGAVGVDLRIVAVKQRDKLSAEPLERLRRECVHGPRTIQAKLRRRGRRIACREPQGVGIDAERCGDLRYLLCARPGEAAFPAADGLLLHAQFRGEFSLLRVASRQPGLGEERPEIRVHLRYSDSVLRNS
ncbi:hypothetical protein ABFU66_10310 [Xanthomonas campestris pv. raphani]